MGKLAQRAEVQRLESLLGTGPQDLAFLESIPLETLRRIREAAQDRLFGDDLTLFQRLAAASVLLPIGVIAMMAEKIFGPVLGARVAGEMNWKRAVELAARLPVKFLADIAVQLDPRRAENIIRNLPPPRIREITADLLQRREFVTMGRFVDFLTTEAIREAIKAFTRPADLLHVGFFVDNKRRLNELIHLLPDSQLMGIIQAAQSDPEELWPEALALMAYVDESLKRRLGDLAAGQDESVLEGLLQTAHHQQLWDDLLPVIACMSEQAQNKVCALKDLSRPDILRGILHSAEQNQLWRSLLPLLDRLPSKSLAVIAELATTELPTEALEKIFTAAHRARLWDSLLRFAGQMDDQQMERIGHATLNLSKDAIEAALRAADEAGLWHAMLPLASRMGEEQKRVVAEHVSLAPGEMRERIVEAARSADHRHWPALMDIVAYIPAETRTEFAGIIQRHARAEPGLVARLAPEARARGLDDLLGIGQAALRQKNTGSDQPTAPVQKTLQTGGQRAATSTSRTAGSGLLPDLAEKEPLAANSEGLVRTTLRRFESVLGLANEDVVEGQRRDLERLQRSLKALADSVATELSDLRAAMEAGMSGAAPTTSSGSQDQESITELQNNFGTLIHRLEALEQSVRELRVAQAQAVTQAPLAITAAPAPAASTPDRPHTKTSTALPSTAKDTLPAKAPAPTSFSPGRLAAMVAVAMLAAVLSGVAVALKTIWR